MGERISSLLRVKNAAHLRLLSVNSNLFFFWCLIKVPLTCIKILFAVLR